MKKEKLIYESPLMDIFVFTYADILTVSVGDTFEGDLGTGDIEKLPEGDW